MLEDTYFSLAVSLKDYFPVYTLSFKSHHKNHIIQIVSSHKSAQFIIAYRDTYLLQLILNLVHTCWVINLYLDEDISHSSKLSWLCINYGCWSKEKMKQALCSHREFSVSAGAALINYKTTWKRNTWNYVSAMDKTSNKSDRDRQTDFGATG